MSVSVRVQEEGSSGPCNPSQPKEFKVGVDRFASWAGGNSFPEGDWFFFWFCGLAPALLCWVGQEMRGALLIPVLGLLGLLCKSRMMVWGMLNGRHGAGHGGAHL